MLIVYYLFELPFLVLDVIGFSEMVGFFQSVFNKSTRGLSADELNMATSIFGNSIQYHKIKIDEQFTVGTNRGKNIYVLFYQVNALGGMSLSTLMHELMHIAQFEQIGSVYIFRNLIAQWSMEKYNYGGLIAIKNIILEPIRLHLLNYEQRAEIVSDYCLILRGQEPDWGDASRSDAPAYLAVIKYILKAPH